MFSHWSWRRGCCVLFVLHLICVLHWAVWAGGREQGPSIENQACNLGIRKSRALTKKKIHIPYLDSHLLLWLHFLFFAFWSFCSNHTISLLVISWLVTNYIFLHVLLTFDIVRDFKSCQLMDVKCYFGDIDLHVSNN